MAQPMAEDLMRRRRRARHSGALVSVSLAYLFVFIPRAAAQTPCCAITLIDAATNVVTAKVTSTGQTFQFKPNTPTLLNSMKVGECVYANFSANQVSLDGARPCACTPLGVPAPSGFPKRFILTWGDLAAPAPQTRLRTVPQLTRR